MLSSIDQAFLKSKLNDNIKIKKHIWFLPLAGFNMYHSIFCCIWEFTVEMKKLSVMGSDHCIAF